MNQQITANCEWGSSIFSVPAPTHKCEMTPGYFLFTSKAPCKFHQLMQRLFFGFKWRKM